MSDANNTRHENTLNNRLEFFPALQRQSSAFTAPQRFTGFAASGVGRDGELEDVQSRSTWYPQC